MTFFRNNIAGFGVRYFDHLKGSRFCVYFLNGEVLYFNPDNVYTLTDETLIVGE